MIKIRADGRRWWNWRGLWTRIDHQRWRWFGRPTWPAWGVAALYALVVLCIGAVAPFRLLISMVDHGIPVDRAIALTQLFTISLLGGSVIVLLLVRGRDR